MTSLLVPDPEHLVLFNGFSDFGKIEREIPVSTRRFDDVAEIDAIDLLKIDIQGGELDAIRSGQTKLANALAIQTEISFVSLYRGQPTFGTMDLKLREMGFTPHCLAELKRWSIAPLVFHGNKRSPGNQLLEADLVYVRDFSQAEKFTGEQWKHLALIAHYCYRSFDLPLRAILGAVRLRALPKDVAQRYVDMLAKQGPPVDSPTGSQP